MELEAEASSDDVGLRADLGVREELRARRQGERVEMPLEPRAFGDQLGILRPHRKPSDLRAVRPERLAAQRARHQLTTETEAKHRHVVLGSLPDELGLTLVEWNGIVES